MVPDWVALIAEYLPSSEFITSESTDSRLASQPSTDETVTMTADERVVTSFIEEQLADLTDAIRQAVQNGIDSPGLFRVLDSVFGAGSKQRSIDGRPVSVAS